MGSLSGIDEQSVIKKALQAVTSQRVEEARTLLDAVSGDTVTDAQSNTVIGQLYASMGDQAKAVAWYTRALQVEPENVVALTALGVAYTTLQQYDYAGGALTKALAANPDHLPAMGAMGALLLSIKDYPNAVNWLEKAVVGKTTDVGVYSNLSLALGVLGRNEEALECAEQARRRHPRSANVLCSLARALISLGRMEEAQRHLLKAVQYEPASGIVYERLAMAKKFTEKDGALIQQCEAQLQAGMPVVERYSALFALGKMYDDLGNYQKAYGYYQQANTLAKPAEKPEVDHHLFRFEKAVCTSARLANARTTGHVSTVPVFIVGMPRSGTSLVEQIIASHPLAAGAGELIEIPRIADVLYTTSKKKTWWLGDAFEMPPRDVWQQQGEEYLAVLRAGHETAQRVTDKLPENFNFLGVIGMLFPEAPIIHVVRHPLDVCLSCYFQLVVGLKWSMDMQWIAKTYIDYRETMAYWKKTLPPGKIVDVHYEQLVSEGEVQCRRLIDSCGLEWDSACLDFFNNGRGVQTASAWQVRQPMYQSSKMRWIKYAPYIGELANALADYLQDDIELLEEHGIKIKRK